ncbi:MAG: glycoside hydrolase family 13 protein [Planctomycetota bacterium]
MASAGTSLISGKPEWVKNSVFYQIFPDRFARSGRLSKPANLLSWSAAPTAQGYHGGDLLGIVEHLDYLVDLGINALYMTPIFQSPCNHRYHTHDYYQVDPLLGGNEGLRELVRAAHERRIRIVLDGVFNHASRGFFQFNDILENGPHSPWLSWFHIENWPLRPYDGRRPANYAGWAQNRALPKFNTDNPGVREFLMGVAEYWIREFDIDGWRLDVPREISTPGFWEEFRERTRALKSDLYTVGEIWHQAPEWLGGERFDATMNYPFAAATIAFTAQDRVSQKLVEDRAYDPYPGIDAAKFHERLQALLECYDAETTRVQLNLLDSHDAPRLLSVARGDKATLRLATLFQMTYPGAPCIYYGNEIALRGTKRYDRPHRDLDARWPFPWHDEKLWDHDMLQYFQKAIALRHRSPVLRRGEMTTVHAADQQYAFARHDAESCLLVLLNAADETAHPRLPVERFFQDGTALVSLFGPPCSATVDKGHLEWNIPARSANVMGPAS